MDDLNLSKISREFFELIMQLHKKVVKPEEFMKSLPMPTSNVKVVFYLAQNGPSSVSNIAKDLCISKPNMTPIIDKLLEAGYVIRYEDPNDRRVLIVEITAKAHEVFKIKHELAISLLKEKLSTLDDTDLNSLSNVICEFSRIISNFKTN